MKSILMIIISALFAASCDGGNNLPDSVDANITPAPQEEREDEIINSPEREREEEIIYDQGLYE